MKMKKLTTFALAAALAIGTFGFSVPAKATEVTTTDYVLTIPATLNVKDAGWNATDGITANNSTHNFDTGKKLSVTATSEHGWKLEADGVTDTVSYNLAASGDNSSTYSSAADPASWEFSAGELNAESGTNKGMGIIVEDYSNKAAGNYTDTVTFTAKVEDAVVIHTTLAVGDVIHLGEVLSISTDYYTGGQAIQSSKSPFTLVRANITEDPMGGATVEAADGQYYVLKGIDGSYCVYIGTPGTSKVEATSTSDGIIVDTLNGNRLYFTTHEPQ